MAHFSMIFFRKLLNEPIQAFKSTFYFIQHNESTVDIQFSLYFV